MKFDYDSAWRDARNMARENRGLLGAIAGIFVFLPYALLLILLPTIAALPELPDDATFEQAMAAMDAFYAQTWWAFALVLVLVTVGLLAMLALLGRRQRPTVGEAIGIAGKAVLPAGLALILQSLGTNFVALAVISIAGLIGNPALLFVAAVLALGLSLYLSTRLSLAAPVVAIGGERNPFKALRRSWENTRGNGMRLLGFYALLFLAVVVVALVATLITGVLAALVGEAGADVISMVFGAALMSAIIVLSAVVLAAVHRQFTRLATPRDD